MNSRPTKRGDGGTEANDLWSTEANNLRSLLTTAQDPETELARMRALSRFLDSAFRIPGTNYRVGADALTGLVPGIGDGLSAVVSLYIIYRAYLLGVPYSTLARMLANILLDATLGSVPVLGDLFDAVWKANERNVALVERRT